MMRYRICWPWCDCREQRRAIRREIRMISYAEGVGGWIPQDEVLKRERLRQQLKG